ncbi:hypothetical protein ACQKMD_21360 [Viridibacillus sp. NPDC096237]|uniref:hypothetical protein n=1 Tax=Viridibacillus sp. NPDC096237 TaxID=3390721 RepID=UPI003CFFDA90
MKNRSAKKVNKLLKTPHIKKALINTTDDTLSNLKIMKKSRQIVIGSLINTAIALTGGTTFGDIAVSILKRFFYSYTKKAKQFYFFGTKKDYEYITFY